MTVVQTPIPDSSEDKEPIYYVPKRVSMISDIANILSWIILVGFICDVFVEIVGLQSQLKSQGIAIATLLHEPSLYVYIFANMVVPLLTGLGFFAVLQAASIGLSMLLETDYTLHETKNEHKA